jgi:Ca2+-binding RTX toxin-like protein
MTTSPFTENDDFRQLTAGNDSIEAGAGDDIVFARAGRDTVDGDVGNDMLLGGTGSDSLLGGDGNDVLVGGTAADTMIGGNDTDIVSYDLVSLTAGSFTAMNDGTWRVVGQSADQDYEGEGPAPIINEGTDRVAVEIVVDAQGKRFLLVGNGGFATIQAAVDAAASGDTILVAGGSFAGATIANKALTIVGSGAGATTITGQISFTGAVAGDTVLRDFTVNAAGQQFGILFNATAAAGSDLTVQGLSVSGAQEAGLQYVRPGNSSEPNITTDLLDAITVTGSSFANNGTGAGSSARSHVNLFGFNGDLSIIGNSFAVSAGSTGRKAIAWTGAPRAAEPYSPAGDVEITGNSFTGSYSTDLIGIYYHASVASFEASGNTANVAAPWGVLNFDGVGGTLDVSGFFSSVTNSGGGIAVLQGIGGNDNITGTNGADLIDGRAGSDVIDAGGGDDLIRISSGSAHDGTEVIDGGDGTDTIVFNPTTTDTLTLGANVTDVEVVSVVGAHPTYVSTGTVAGSVDASAVIGVTALNGNDGANSLTAGAGSQTLSGNGGDDVLKGGAADDVLLGGGGTDTAVFDAGLNLSAITSSGGVWTVPTGGAEGTDQVSGVEVLDDSGAGLVLLVGNGGFATIQAALDYADVQSLGGRALTVLVAGGTPNVGAFSVGSGIDADTVTIRAVGEVVIDGTFHEVNAIDVGTTTSEFLRTATSYTAPAGAGATIGRGNVTLEGLTISDFTYGVTFTAGTHEDVVLRGVTLAQNIAGVRVGTTGVTVNGLSIEDGTIRDGYQGIILERATTNGSVFNDLSVDGTVFQRMTEKGIYLEGLNGGSFTDLVMTDVGQWGRGPAFGGTGANVGGFGAGIDINLKYGSFTGAIEITGFTFTDVGNSDTNGGTASHFGGAAITVKARNDGPSYASPPANYTGTITVADGTVDGTSTFFRLGEPGKNPTNVQHTPVTGAGIVVNITDVDVTGYVANSLHGLVDNLTTQGQINVTLSDADETASVAGHSFGKVLILGGDGDDVLTGGDGSSIGGVALSGNETLIGGAGDDEIAGGAGTDRAEYETANLTIDSFTPRPRAGWWLPGPRARTRSPAWRWSRTRRASASSSWARATTPRSRPRSMRPMRATPSWSRPAPMRSRSSSTRR